MPGKADLPGSARVQWFVFAVLEQLRLEITVVSGGSATNIQYRKHKGSLESCREVTHVSDAPVIAIVDDDHSVLRALERLIRSAGYSAKTFASGEDFIQSLQRGHPSCLVLDIHLDGMSGFSLQEHLAANEMNIPVVFVTAYDDELTRQRIERSGAIGWLRKPLDQEELLGAIGRALAADGTP